MLIIIADDHNILKMLQYIAICAAELWNTSEIRQDTLKYVTKSTYFALYPCIEHIVLCIQYADSRTQ